MTPTCMAHKMYMAVKVYIQTTETNSALRPTGRVAVDMDIHGYIHGYIHVWISNLAIPWIYPWTFLFILIHITILE